MPKINNFSNDLPIIVGISGSSGTIYGLRLIDFLLKNNFKVELVFSESALKVSLHELDLHFSSNPDILKQQVLSYLSLSSSKNLNVWSNDDIAASISSGSYKTLGMIIIPSSMGTIGAIASGTSDNLLTRSADVSLKEKRTLILVPREMPFSSIHLENLLKLSRCGAIVAPACPGFYNNPKSLDDSINFVVGKVLDLIGVEHELFIRWNKNNSYSEN